MIIRIEKLAPKNLFITLKDHKNNFMNNPSCRLISPTKSEIGLVSKKIIDRIVKRMVEATGCNPWQNTGAVIQGFKKIQGKDQSTFVNFDIVDFNPSISDCLRVCTGV